MHSEAGVIARLEQEGFTEHFVVKGSALRSIETGHTFTPAEVDIREFARYEGVSNPSDMSIVYAIESRGGVRGTLVDAFGAYADPNVAAFVEAVDEHRAEIVPIDVGTTELAGPDGGGTRGEHGTGVPLTPRPDDSPRPAR
jgi:hypothetical protein